MKRGKNKKIYKCITMVEVVTSLPTELEDISHLTRIGFLEGERMLAHFIIILLYRLNSGCLSSHT